MSGFSNNELLKSVSDYPVAKGDVVGHEFHGNQYSIAPRPSAWLKALWVCQPTEQDTKALPSSIPSAITP